VRLGLNVGYWTWGAFDETVALVREAEGLGYAVAWVAEAYGSDAVTALTWIAARTERIDVGTAILQIPARTPTMTAMTAASLDMLSGGRLRLGLGVSGPQVSEGWHGVRFAKPLARTREYVDIVRMALRRERVRYDGDTYRLPLPDGPGKALFLQVHPLRADIPIYLAAIGPKNLELTGEIADGWLPVFYDPRFGPEHLEHIRAGRARAGKSMDGFDVAPALGLSVGEDVAACADPLRGYTALYVGGMGSREQNFYNDLAVRMGYGDAAAAVQQHYLARDYEAAMAAVPAEFIDATSLLGPRERLADRLVEFAEAGVTTLNVMPYGATPDERVAAIRTLAEALDKAGVGS
jgi:F420-dependent oxidoreductase-like protein